MRLLRNNLFLRHKNGDGLLSSNVVIVVNKMPHFSSHEHILPFPLVRTIVPIDIHINDVTTLCCVIHVYFVATHL